MHCIERAGILLSFFYIPYVVHNSISLATDCISVPDTLVNLLIGQHTPFIDRKRIEDVKFLFCHTDFVGISVNLSAFRPDFQTGEG